MHYDAIVLKKKNNDGDDSFFQLPEDDDILTPSQLFTPVLLQLHPDLAKYNVTEHDIFHMDITVFRGMAGKRVGVQPYDIDGNVMCNVKRINGMQNKLTVTTGQQQQETVSS